MRYNVFHVWYVVDFTIRVRIHFKMSEMKMRCILRWGGGTEMRAAGKQSRHWCNVEYRCYVNTMPIRSIQVTIWFTFLLIFLCRYWSRSLLCVCVATSFDGMVGFSPRKHFNGMRVCVFAICAPATTLLVASMMILITLLTHFPIVPNSSSGHFYSIFGSIFSRRYVFDTAMLTLPFFYSCCTVLECCLKRIQCLQIGWNGVQC